MEGKRLVVQNTNVLEMGSLSFQANKTVVMENNKFTWIGDEGSYEKQEDDHLINGEGKYAIPGMMDLHVHLSYVHSALHQREAATMRHKDSYWEYWGLKNAQEYLRWGFTTVRGCGSHKGLSSLRDMVNQGIFTGPRMKLALNTIVQPGNQELFGPHEIIDLNKSLQPSSGRDGLIDAVRDRRADGSDHIKTTTTGGVVHGKGSDVNLSLWRDEELEAMVSEAERLGMYVAAHAHADAGIAAAARTGVRSIEHCTMPTEETLNEIKKRGTFVVPTQAAVNYIHFAPEQVKKVLAPEIVSKWIRVSENANQMHQLALEKGIPLALGTDAPVFGDHCHSHVELRLLVKNVGMTPLQAIEAGSMTAARVIRMDDQLGSIDVGKLADLVILEKNPESDIMVFGDMNNINRVVKDGSIVSEKGRLVHQV